MYKNILKNTSKIVLSGITSKTINYITFFLIARYLGVTFFGDFNTVVAYVTLFIIFADVGMKDFLIREFVKAPNKIESYLGNAIFLVLSFSIIAFGVMMFAAYWLNYSSLLLKLIMIFGFAMILKSIKNIYVYGLYDARMRFGLSAIIDSGSAMLQLVLIVLLIFLKVGIKGIIYAYLLGSILELGIVLLSSFILKLGTPIIDFGMIRGMLTKAAPFFLDSIFELCYYRVGILMLYSMTTASNVGLYSAAYRIIGMMAFIPLAFNRCLAPILYGIDCKNRTDLKNIFENIKKYMTFLAILLTFAFILLAGPIINILYGQQYKGSITVLMIISPSLIFRLLAYAFGPFIIATDQIKKGMIIMGMTTSVNIILNFVLISRYGVIGASIAMVISDAMLAIMAYIVLSNIFYGHSSIKETKSLR